VFAGGFTLEAAEEVCGDGEVKKTEVLGLLSRLVDQSLVIPDDGGEARFRMLETLRRYAGERLEESGTADGLQRRHAAYFRGLAERAEPLLRGPEQGVWLHPLETDHDNFSAGIDWALRHDPEVAVRLSGGLAWFWNIGGHPRPGGASTKPSPRVKARLPPVGHGRSRGRLSSDSPRARRTGRPRKRRRRTSSPKRSATPGGSRCPRGSWEWRALSRETSTGAVNS
jgi:hypothetical protein